jgi:hypothetical protein
MTYEEFLEFVPSKCMYETIYDDSDGRPILVIRMLDAYGMVNKAQEPDFGPQPGMLAGMNQDDWKDIVAAISKARDSRGIYLGCRPADVFQDWFLAMGLFKEKTNDT